MKMYEELKEMLCRELEEITRKGELSAGSLDIIDKLTHSIKSIETIMSMAESDDYSYRGSYANDGRGGNRGGNRGGMSRESMNDGRSGARRRRDRMGRYSRNDYSYADAKDDMMDDLRELMEKAPDETMRRKLQKFVNELED